MNISERLEKSAREIKKAQCDLESLDSGARKTVLFKWASMMGKTSEEAAKLADRTPDAEGKWEGVKLTERKEILAKIQEAFRS